MRPVRREGLITSSIGSCSLTSGITTRSGSITLSTPKSLPGPTGWAVGRAPAIRQRRPARTSGLFVVGNCLHSVVCHYISGWKANHTSLQRILQQRERSGPQWQHHHRDLRQRAADYLHRYPRHNRPHGQARRDEASGSVSPVAFTWSNPQGGTSSASIVYTSETVQTAFDWSGIGEYTSTAQQSLITKINQKPPDLFLVLIMHLLRDGGHGAMVLPEAPAGQGVKIRIKQDLLERCNLHTVVRLPKNVFAPYTPTQTNLLFFNKGEPTKKNLVLRTPLSARHKELQ